MAEGPAAASRPGLGQPLRALGVRPDAERPPVALLVPVGRVAVEDGRELPRVQATSALGQIAVVPVRGVACAFAGVAAGHGLWRYRQHRVSSCRKPGWHLMGRNTRCSQGGVVAGHRWIERMGEPLQKAHSLSDSRGAVPRESRALIQPEHAVAPRDAPAVLDLQATRAVEVRQLCRQLRNEGLPARRRVRDGDVTVAEQPLRHNAAL
mmetsp:Transcript_97075/g.307938  ORF Transcript_97075/g.307938 Transcript_97075/m.307938 type:complete len:208 (-) Transcript_97075:263-886(-)